MMKLWILRPKTDLPADDDPWRSWYDRVFGFVIQAESAEDARALADCNAGDENNDEQHPWLNPQNTDCIPLLVDGPAKVILRDRRGA